MWSPGWGWTLAGLGSIAWIGTWVAGGSARLELLVSVAYRGNKHPKLHGQAAVFWLRRCQPPPSPRSTYAGLPSCRSCASCARHVTDRAAGCARFRGGYGFAVAACAAPTGVLRTSVRLE